MDRGEASWKDLGDHLGANARRTAGTMLGDRITPEFYAGLAAGFFGNPKDSAVELWGLAKAAVRYAPKFLEYSPIGLPIKVLWEFTGGDRFETEILVASDIGRQAYGLAEKAGSYWPQVREFLDSMGDGAEAKLQHFLATGEFPGSEKLCPAVKTAIFAAVNLYLMAAGWWNELEPYKRGYYQGYVMFEVVLAVVAGVITAPAGGVGAAATLARRVPLLSKLLTHLGPKLRAMNSKLGGQLDPLISKIDEMLSAITGARAGSWCFVAGTMIMTAQGAVPIEQIREGDLVWSAHEETGEAGLRPVIELYRNEAEEIWTVRYAGTEDGAPVRELRCTGEHPFWSETERSFVPASELKPGGELRLFGGEVARVVSVTPHRGPPGVKTRVYNFAVAEHHTYFAGDGGVWVHNVCSEGLERLVTRYVSILETGNSSKTEAMGEVFDWMRRDGGFSEEDFQHAAEYLFSKAIDDIAEALLRSNPNSYPTHRELITMRAQSGIEGQFIESHHLLHKKLAQDVILLRIKFSESQTTGNSP